MAAARARPRGRPHDAKSQSEARGSRPVAGSEHTTRMGSPGRPTLKVVAGRPSYPAVAEVSIPRGSGRHEARRSRAAQSNSESTAATSPDSGRQSGSREDSELESSQTRLGLDLLEHLPELGKGCIYFGDYFIRPSIAALLTRKVGPCCSLFLSCQPALVEAAAPAADAAAGTGPAGRSPSP